MIEVRKSSISDAPAIIELLNALGYPDSDKFIEKRINQLNDSQDAEILVASDEDRVVGFVSVHFIPQLALAGDYCRITYFCVSEAYRNQGVGSLLEAGVVSLAKQRGCLAIELHCHSRRVDAHRFYFGINYQESPKYLIKSLAVI
ncbi:MAG: GNAT family N-acetyltransferase [Desulfobulbus sp.]